MGTGQLTKTESTSLEGTKYIDSRCIVEFRPDDNWDGEYGFDWFRLGIHGEQLVKGIGAPKTSNYYSLVGEYYPCDPDHETPNDNKFAHFYEDKHKIAIKKLFKNEYKTLIFKDDKFRKRYPDGKYIVPYVSLFPPLSLKERIKIINYCKKNNLECDLKHCKSKATVKLYVHAENIEKIEFQCSNDAIAIDNRVFFPTGNLNKEGFETTKITITCEKEISEDVSVFAIAHHKDKNQTPTPTVAGKLIVVKSNPKILDVCMVNVAIKGEKNSFFYGECSDEVLNGFRKLLAQAQIIPCTRKLKLDIDLNKFKSKYEDVVYKDITPYFVVSNRVIKQISGLTIGYKIDNIFNDDETCKKYKNKYKLFFTKLVCCKDDKTLGGFYIKESSFAFGQSSKGYNFRSAIIFENHSSSTVCHELFHCLGLHHSFSNENIIENKSIIKEKTIMKTIMDFLLGEEKNIDISYTYRQGKTSNIMDYPFDKEDNEKSNSFDLISLWRWQWDIVNCKGVEIKKIF